MARASGVTVTGQGAAPACTGTWNRATNTVMPGACRRAKKYPTGELCYLGDC